MGCCAGCSPPPQNTEPESAEDGRQALNNGADSESAQEITSSAPLDSQDTAISPEPVLENICSDVLIPSSSDDESFSPVCQDGCCGPKPPVTIHLDAGADAGAKTNTSEQPDPPACCEGKPSPCCDASCLDRIALRTCNEEHQASSCDESKGKSSQTSPGCRDYDTKPCGFHRRKARDAYAATLEALGCICRALVALGQESCCLPPAGRVSLERKFSSQPSSISSRSSVYGQNATKGCADSCCTAPTTTRSKIRRRSKDSCRQENIPAVAAGGCFDGCCEKASVPAAPDSSAKACCTQPQSAILEESCAKGCCDKPTPPVFKPCAQGCCDTPPHEIVVSPVQLCSAETASCCEKKSSCCEKKSSCCEIVAPLPPISLTTDLEQGTSGRENIVLSVSGMTCTGCETNLQRALAPLASVQNLKTSLVLARAEFDLDGGLVADVVKHVERTTGFKCERLTKGFSIGLIVDDPTAFIQGKRPDGVTDIALVNHNTAQVAYDPKIIGARDLAERGWDSPLALAPPRPDPTLAASSNHVRHVGYMTLLSIVLTVPVLVLAWAPLPDREMAYQSASLALATIVQVVVAGPFYPKAIKALVFSRVVEMDLIIVLSTSAAFIFSVVSFAFLTAGKPLATGSFFETSTLLVMLIMVGRYAAALARQKAVESISIRSLQVNTALLVTEDNLKNGTTGPQAVGIDARLLQLGDIFKAIPETRIPTDGTVISGVSEVDESMITGESRPVDKRPGDVLIAGTINGSSTLTARVTRIPGDNTIDTIAGMVDQAKLSKPRMQDLADRVASYFVPVVVCLMFVTLVIWIASGMAVRQQTGSEAVIDAVTYAITVLIVSCPCAIGLAIPMVVVIATGVGADHGVIFKSAESIEVAYRATHVILDKTGTLTKGSLSVASDDDFGQDTTPALLLGLLDGVKHPVSLAVAVHLKAKGITPAKVENVQSVPGKGVKGTTSTGLVLRAGNSRWLNVSSDPRVQTLLSQGYTVFCFTINNTLAGVFGLEDSLREDTLPTIKTLLARNISVHVLSGDDDGAVRAVTTQLGIPDSLVRSRCTPADKQTYVQDLLTTHTTTSGKPPVVIFCGDGTNDAVALAQATVGIAINRDGSGAAEAAKSAADVVLMRPDLKGILTVMELSKRSVHRIVFNFAWSFAYNLFAILLAAGAFVNVRIPPQFAGLGELVSVLPVIAAAVLLRWAKV
ncbi:E1-E2 ATPase-domain-containing protein [Podospora australis]|uniref:E1-E2 ATPase-domain-containing protein n=1 Tax=Podospora australis TaxID=1536484 RepID=A0AAN6WY05_9PEZI|nr:E1-E2 ATPase-domain-containing protein [Podospora australis]